MPFDGTTLEPWQQTLLRAAEIVRERWHQGDIGAFGGPVCAIGAIKEAAGAIMYYHWPDLAVAACDQLDRLARVQLNEPDVVVVVDDDAPVRSDYLIGEWNDTPGRTAEEVAQAMEQCALRADK